ncbi:CopD family protein [Deinococcus sp. PESE-13]
MSRLLLFLGLALLLGGAAARRWLAPVPLRWLSAGLALLFVGAGLSVYQPLRELGLLAPADVLDYLTAVSAGRAALVLLLAATLFLVAEVQKLPALILAGLGGWALWGMAGIGHGGVHGDVVRGLHALHAGAMSIWLGGLGALLRVPAPDRLAVARRFSPVAAACVGLLVLTGLGMSLEHIHSLRVLQSTPYGQTLLLKLLAFVGVLGAAFAVRRSLAGTGPGRRLGLEVLALVAVLLLTARLGGLPLVH